MSETSPNADRERMRFRGLRIAWSALCVLACMLLVALWVRSYWWGEAFTIPIHKTWFRCSDLRGSIVLTCFDRAERMDIGAGYSWGRASGQRLDEHFPRHFYGFYFKKDATGLGLVVPIWFLLAVGVGCAVAPWYSWRRFTTRTLLIATTLVAAVLGVAVYLSK